MEIRKKQDGEKIRNLYRGQTGYQFSTGIAEIHGRTTGGAGTGACTGYGGLRLCGKLRTQGYSLRTEKNEQPVGKHGCQECSG